MKEYQELIDKYSFKGYSIYSNLISEEKWGNKKVAQQYLEKYWLSEAEYQNIWKPIQDKIFINQKYGLPELIFAQGYEIIALRGGVLFEEDDFKKLQHCFLQLGNSHFVVIENTFGDRDEKSFFRLKFPSNISWQEIMSGNFISSVLCEMFQNEYFVFGETDSWGKYAANDYETPLDLIGFKKDYATLFRDSFKVSNEEKEEIQLWLPEAYKKFYD